MEPHPVPQNVTSFQFHLIGDMTLKQFGYLAAGSTIAYILFVFVAPNTFLAWPLILISAFSGFALAFIPINSRPLDLWVKAFFKAVYSPTKRIWKKNSKNYQEEPLFKSRFITFLSGLGPVTTPIQPIPQVQALSPTPPPVQMPKPSLPTPDDLAKTVNLAQQAQSLQTRIVQTERQLAQIRQATQAPSPIPVDYSGEVNKILADLQGLVSQASDIKGKLQTVTSPQLPKITPIPIVKEKVKVVVSEKPKPNQLALTTFPNVISGIIKDRSGNYLEGAVAVIYDKEGLPVRALKTNKLGQFSGSTPLPNGVYTLELEKDNFSFDVLQIELAGEVLPPLMITSKN